VEAQSYAKHTHEYKESAGLKEVSIGYVIAGDFASTPKSAQYTLLRKGALEEKDVKRLQKCPTVRTVSRAANVMARSCPLLLDHGGPNASLLNQGRSAALVPQTMPERRFGTSGSLWRAGLCRHHLRILRQKRKGKC
jgi:hypothetical protein